MFPIHDLQGRPISLGGRFIPRPDGSPLVKPTNHCCCRTPNTSTVPRRCCSTNRGQLYGLHLARPAMQRTGHVLVMEGYTDVIATRQAGIEPVVAVLGTALGENHIELLRRFVDRVVLVLDGDEAGRTRADQVLELFVSANVDLRIITLPGNADPRNTLNSMAAKRSSNWCKTPPTRSNTNWPRSPPASTSPMTHTKHHAPCKR